MSREPLTPTLSPRAGRGGTGLLPLPLPLPRAGEGRGEGLLLFALFMISSTASAQTQCTPAPLEGRALYLRGSFNSWTTPEAQRFTWACNRYVLVTSITGEHQFKVGDEGWRSDADFGADDPLSTALVAKGREFKRRFAGTTRLTVTLSPQPQLQIENCPMDAPPLANTTLYLRGTMNNWGALDDYAFQFSCDAYYLNIDIKGRHEFKIADAAWKDATSYGAGQDAYLKEGGASLAREFSGQHTLRLAWAGGRPELSVGPKTFADPKAVAVTDPVARSLAFDSRAAAHKSPFGAAVAGTPMNFAVDALPGVEKMTLVIEKRRLEGNQEVLEYTEVARVPMSKSTSLPTPVRPEPALRQGSPEHRRRAQDDRSSPVRPEPVEGLGGVPRGFDKALLSTVEGLSPNGVAVGTRKERWTATHRFADISVYGYWFEAQIAGKTYAFQNNRNAVHWTREKGSGGAGEVGELGANTTSVRRFRQTVYAADFKVPDWAADVIYYYVFPERFRNGNKANDPRPGRDKYQNHTVELHKSWHEKPFRPGSGDGGDAVYNNDFFGGDLAGIIDKLDYIKDLGANTIYMTPVFKAPSNHKYDTADYTQIDPAFGTNADFERLTREAQKRGIRVVPDTSLNHVGSDSVYFDRFRNHKESGAFEGGRINPASPYASWFSFDASQKDADKQYKGWVGVNDLPELNKASPAWRNFAYKNPDSVMKRWLDRGAAGWRMDVVPWVPDDFWREWRTEIKRHQPDALTVSETWFDSSKYLLGDMFDSTMNYIFRNAVIEYAAGGKAVDLVSQLEAVREAYPPQAFHALMNLLSTHDAARALHQFGFHDDTTDAAVIARAKQRLLLAAFIQMTYPGAPTIYYGDEVGVTGGEDPYNRATYPWEDVGGKPDKALLAEFKKLTAMRHRHAVLRRGALLAPLHVSEHVIVFAREHQGARALVAVNNAASAQTVEVSLPQAWRNTVFADALESERLVAANAKLTLQLAPTAGRVLIATP
jgi:cyclomaltodextrinase / maltogenic alpha-amylase / neopullulanase